MPRPVSCSIIASVLISVLLVSVGLAGPKWISLDGVSDPASPSVSVLSSDDKTVIIECELSGFWMEDVKEGEQVFRRLRLPGYSTTREIGKAELPAICELVGIPGTTQAKAEVVGRKEVTLTGYSVYPFQTPLLDGETRVSFDIDQEFYRRSAFYPDLQAEVGKPGIWRDLRVIGLKVYPIRFNPVTEELLVCTSVTVKIEFSGTSDINVKISSRPVAPDYDRLYGCTVLNYRHLNIPVRSPQGSYRELDEDYDYLIIAPDGYVDYLTPLSVYKDSIDLITRVTPLSEIGYELEDIKDYIIQEYNDSNIRYVLLVGDESWIPCYPCGWNSDYYYALVEGDDDYPDIAVGRFSVVSAAQVQRMVQKSISYESDPPMGNWLTNALLIAHKENAGSQGSYQWAKEAIRTAYATQSGTYSVLYPDFTTAYGAAYADGGDEATNADVIAAINTGQRVVNYRGHGSMYCWGGGTGWNTHEENFATSDVCSLDNGSKTPVIFSIACSTNNLEAEDPCLGEAFTRCEEGAVAFLGGGLGTHTGPNNYYDRRLFALIFDEGVSSIGDASNAAAVYIINHCGQDGLTTARRYMWLGEPSLTVIYREEVVPAPPAPTLVSPVNGYTYFIPPIPKYLYLDWEDVLGADYYHAMVDDDQDFSSPIVSKTNLINSQLKNAFSPFAEEDTYYWRVRAANEQGYGLWSEVWHFVVSSEGILADVDTGTRPGRYALHRNYPNPFGNTSVISFQLPQPTHVILEVFDGCGNHIATLVDQEMGVGHHQVQWDGRDGRGRPVSSGIYFTRLSAGTFSQTGKLVVTR